MNETEGIAADPVAQNGPRQYTYTKALEAKGVTRDSPAYRQAIDEALTWLRQHRSFYGFIVDEMTRSTSLGIRTAQVEIKGTSICMTMNPDFMALMPMRHRAGVIMHECLHIMNLHIPRMRSMLPLMTERQKRLMPVIFDLPVNSLISDPRDLPDWAIRPEHYRIPESGKDKALWPQFPARKTLEFYNDLIGGMTDEQLRQCLSAAGDGLTAPRADGDAESQVSLDDHEQWLSSDVDVIDNELMTEVIKNHVRNASNRALAQGVGSGDLAELIAELLRERSVNFRGLFQSLVGRFVTMNRKPTMMRDSRRYGSPPGRRMSRKLDVRFYQDTSGSMSSEEVLIGMSEARHAHDTGLARVVVQQFDWSLQGPPTPIESMGTMNVGVKGRGGTSLRDVVTDIDKHNPDLVFIATDGGLEHDLRPSCGANVVWLLTSGGMAPPWGMVLRLPTLDEIKAGNKAKGMTA